MTKYQCPDCYMIYKTPSNGCGCGSNNPTIEIAEPAIKEPREIETEANNRPLHFPQLIERPKISHSDFCLNRRKFCPQDESCCDICEIAFTIGYTRGRPEIIQQTAQKLISE